MTTPTPRRLLPCPPVGTGPQAGEGLAAGRTPHKLGGGATAPRIGGGLLVFTLVAVAACDRTAPPAELVATPAAAALPAAEAATAAMQAGNYAEAYCLWRSRAAAGDADAQFNLGWLYHNGYGLAVNDVEAARWWQLATERGHTDAQFALGSLYRLGGRDFPADAAKALPHLAAAAEAGEEDAALALQDLLREGGAAVADALPALLKANPDVLGPRRRLTAAAVLRTRPDLDADPVLSLPAGAALVQLARDGAWREVGVPGDGQRGWVKAAVLAEVAPDAAAGRDVPSGAPSGARPSSADGGAGALSASAAAVEAAAAAAGATGAPVAPTGTPALNSSGSAAPR